VCLTLIVAQFLPSDDESIDDFTREHLDHAFLANATKVDQVNLNKCFLDDGDMTSDSESAFGDDSECSSLCELERNVYDVDDVNETTLRRLRVMFSDGDLTNFYMVIYKANDLLTHMLTHVHSCYRHM